MISLKDYEPVEFEVKAADMFDWDDVYQPSPPQYNTCSPKYFPMPPTPRSSSYNIKFLEEDNYFPEPPFPNSLVDGVIDLADDEYFPEPPRVPEISYPSFEDEEDDKYNPKPSVYPEINYSSEDDQDQAGL
ncbi:hypothetical protein R1flu_004349 [Riccia fluitans]|uniref:Uncharacterized protein n=1 Tax=Riccia fluitans TaxID=41844 RepID=A0ABD1YQ09_9MARC